MRRLILLSTVLSSLALASSASAARPHVVQPGESLWSIAAANNFTTRALAAYNGLPETAVVAAGQTVQIPWEAEAAAAMQAAGMTPRALAVALMEGRPVPAASTSSAPAAGTTAAASDAPPALGGYKVRWGDTLSGLAAQARVSVAAMAAMNGLDPNGVLVEGTVLKLPTGAPTPARASAPAPAETVVPPAAPEPTSTRVDAGTIQSIAAEHGVPPSLATAIAWQESGFNNSMVSSANARGVMQVMPGTWDYVQQNLAARPLDPTSATDNVHAGVLYLKRLLHETGGDQATAAAGYYQGISSVRRIGMLGETKQYVANVQALQGRFGGR